MKRWLLWEVTDVFSVRTMVRWKPGVGDGARARENRVGDGAAGVAGNSGLHGRRLRGNWRSGSVMMIQ